LFLVNTFTPCSCDAVVRDISAAASAHLYVVHERPVVGAAHVSASSNGSQHLPAAGQGSTAIQQSFNLKLESHAASQGCRTWQSFLQFILAVSMIARVAVGAAAVT
jgi:hypothetical protein